ncbi:MAG: 50S ribosomal protein L30 [Candidatus Aenigmatarchaeota archaeon]
MLAVIRLRGTVNMRKDKIETLRLMRLNRKMHCVLIPENKSYKGMIQMAKDYITWGTISDALLEKLIAKRGRKTGDVRLNAEEVKQIINELKNGASANELGIKPVFRLNPPSGGFKHGIKHAYPKGELGNRKEKINELLEKMI